MEIQVPHRRALPAAEVTGAPPHHLHHFLGTSEKESLHPEADIVPLSKWLKYGQRHILFFKVQHCFYLQVAILQVSDPKGLLTVVERQHGLHSVNKQLQALLQGWYVVGQACILTILSINTLWHNSSFREHLRFNIYIALALTVFSLI